MATTNSVKTRADALGDRIKSGGNSTSADAKDAWARIQEEWDEAGDKTEDFLNDMEDRIKNIGDDSKDTQ